MNWLSSITSPLIVRIYMKPVCISLGPAFFFTVALCVLQVPSLSTAAEDTAAYSSVEERRLLTALENERSSLEQERIAVEEKKKELKRLEEEVDKKLDQLEQQRIALEKLLADKDAVEQKRIQDLSKMYEKMSADKAAMIFDSLDPNLAVSLLERMKTKSAAKILNNLNREKAAELTTDFSTLDTP